MQGGKKMTLCTVILNVFFAVLFIHNAEGYSSLPTLTNYNHNATSETTHIKRILAFGDSLTEGYLSGGRKFYPYTTKLEEKLNAYFNWSRFEVLNEGISGECVFTEMVTRLPKILDRVGDRADLVIILGGTNDFHKLDCIKRVNVAHEVISLHKICHKRGLRTVLVTIPECSSLGKKCDKARQRVNDKLRGYVKLHENNTLLCDLGKFMPLHNMSSFDRKVYWDDDVHPSKIGYDKIAALLFHTIREWLLPPAVEPAIPNDDSDDKTVPDPDPINKLNKHKSGRSKKKEKHDKKLVQKLVSEVNPVSTNVSNLNTETSSFTPANSQTISALPSVSSESPTVDGTATSATDSESPPGANSNTPIAVDNTLSSTNPTYTDKPASSRKKPKSTRKRKNKYKKLSAAVAAAPEATVSSTKQQPQLASNSVSSSNNASSNASPAASTATTTSTSSSNEATSTNKSSDNPTKTSNPYELYFSTNSTPHDNSNDKPIDNKPAAGALPSPPPKQPAYAVAPSINITQTPAPAPAPAPNNNPIVQYSKTETNTAVANTPSTQSNSNTGNTAASPNVTSAHGDVGDLRQQFPEFSIHLGQ